MPRTAQFDRHKALDDAVNLFWKSGYGGTSMKQIEQALDMRPGSLYATFGSKDGLFREALDTYAGQMSDTLSQSMAAESTIMDGLSSYLRNMARTITAPGTPARACLMVKTLLEVTDQQPELRQQVNQRLTQVEDRLTELLTRARNQGELREDVDCRRLGRLVQAQIMGLRSLAQRQISETEVENLAEDMITALGAFTRSGLAA